MQAGINNVNVYHLHITDNRLIQIGSKHRCPAHMAVADAAKAVGILLGGKTVYLQAEDDAILETVKGRLRALDVQV